MFDFKNITDVVAIIITIVGSILGGYLFNIIIFKIYNLSTRHIQNTDLVPKHLKPYIVFLIFVFLFSISIGFVRFHNMNTVVVIKTIINILYIVALSLIVIRFIYIFEEFILRKYSIQESDNLEARKIYTQIKYFKKIVIIIVSIIALSLTLMHFKQLKQIGITLLTSAGIIGIVIGFAAQKTLNLIIAGLQIAITQPIRIDDVLIIEGEWGRVEEITLTYVVLRIWDLRRLVIPVNYFIEKPFQNWTRVSADLLGTVYIYTDYTASIDVIRNKLHHILDNSPLWDKKVWGLQVTKSTEHAVELRALMSAIDSSELWNLRCLVREELVKFIQEHYPYALPKTRNEVNIKR